MSADYKSREEIGAAFAKVAEGARIVAEHYAAAFKQLGEAVGRIHVEVPRLRR